jgi:hypothetical protein
VMLVVLVVPGLAAQQRVRVSSAASRAAGN